MLIENDVTEAIRKAYECSVEGLRLSLVTRGLSGDIELRAKVERGERVLSRSWRIGDEEIERFATRRRLPRALLELEGWLADIEYVDAHPIGWDANGAPCEVMP